MRAALKGKNGWHSIWAAYRYRARKKGFTWKLTEAQFNLLLKQPCHYCGDAPSEHNKSSIVTVKGVREFYNGVDRINNKPIYSIQTTVPCCARCNIMKNNLTKKEFLSHAAKVTAHTRTKTRT